MPEIPELEGSLGDDVVELRAIEEWDIPEILIAHQDDSQMYKRLGVSRPPSGAQLGAEVENADEERRAGRRVSLTILQRGDRYCVGRVDVHQIDWEEGSAELGIWIAPQVRGRGLATRALQQASAWLLEIVGLRQLKLVTQPDNEPMQRAAIAAGFAPDESAGGAPAGAPHESQTVLERNRADRV
jgi:RimJ/RimL family protein N-acetyltransferase